MLMICKISWASAIIIYLFIGPNAQNLVREGEDEQEYGELFSMTKSSVANDRKQPNGWDEWTESLWLEIQWWYNLKNA